MDDLISRQAALEALEEVCEQECEYSRNRRSLMCGACYVGSAINAISAVPAAPPERKAGQWIPVAERKPDKRDVYLVTLDDGCCPITYVALWQDNAWVSADDIFLLGDTEITAWMPRPRPWEGEK